jgi:hypothetical protein
MGSWQASCAGMELKFYDVDKFEFWIIDLGMVLGR